GVVIDRAVIAEAALPAGFQRPLARLRVPLRAPRVQAPRDAERLARQVDDVEPREGVVAAVEVGVVENPRLHAEQPLIRGLVKGLRRLLAFANQVAQAV